MGTTYVLILAMSLLLAPVLYALTAIPALGLADYHGARLAAMVTLAPTTFLMTVPLFGEYRGHFALSSAARTFAALVTFVATVYLVVTAHLAVFGAMLGMAIGQTAGVAVLLGGFVVLRLPIRPAFDWDYVRRVVPLGIPIQLGLLMVIGAARVDVLMVAAFQPATDVGYYSVALSVGQLASLGSVALAFALVPKVARASSEELRPAVAHAMRLGAWSTGVLTVVLAAAARWLVPLVFGRGFEESVVPTLLLLPGAGLNGIQWIAARSSAARGRTRAFPRTFGATLAALLVLDLLLIPPFGLAGAAIASSGSYVVGLAVALADLRSEIRAAAPPSTAALP